jgi:hypothetical protein
MIWQFTCASCGGTFKKGWSDEEAAAEAQELFPGIDVSDPDEAGVVCDGCFRHIMDRARAEAPEMIGPGWREASGCYTTAGGSMVHVKPGCRCKR